MRLHSALSPLVFLAATLAGCVIHRRDLHDERASNDADLAGVDAPGLDAWGPDSFQQEDAFAPEDAFTQEDAFTADDAFANDAFTPMDAFVPADAFRAPDAFTRPDAFASPDTGCNGRDDDGDGLHDPCDPWPCGAMPTIASSVSGDHITLSAIRINGGGNTLVTRGGGSVGVNMHYAITEVDRAACDCIQQIEVGSVDGQFEACIYDANPPSSGGSGNDFVDFAMPRVSRPTRVDLRFALGLAYDCGTDWSSPTLPPEAQTFGVVCVIP